MCRGPSFSSRATLRASHHPSCRTPAFLLLALVLLLAAGGAEAGVGSWTDIRVPGPATSLGQLEQGADGTLYLSYAAGNVWTYPGVDGRGLLVSRDGGESWQQIVEAGTLSGSPSDGLVFREVPSEGRLLAGYPSPLFSSQPGRLRYESRDGGRTWRRFDPGVDAVTVSPQDPEVWYGVSRRTVEGRSGCPSPGRYVVRSEDAGRTWRALACESVAADAVVPVPGAPGEVVALWRELSTRARGGAATAGRRRPP